MLRFITAASLIASGTMAHMMSESQAAPMLYGYNSAPAQMSEPAMTTSTMMDDVMTSSMMMDESTSTMMDESTSTMMDDSSAMMTDTAMMYGAETTSMMMEDTTSVMPESAMMTSAPMYASVMPMSYGSVMTHSVVVGGEAGLEYSPSTVIAAIGDIIEFTFMKQNHSVTQSTFDKPCVKMPGGMDSGLMANPNNTVVPAPTFQFTVMDMKPTWWYCKQRLPADHCGKGMVFAVNPTMEKSFATFQSMAIAQNGTMAASMGSASYQTMASGSTVTLIGDTTSTMMNAYTASGAVATASYAAAAPAMVTGTGSNSGGSCQCSCFCGVAAYPPGWGVGNMGGMGGVMPAPWASSSASAAAVDAPMSTGSSNGSYGSYGSGSSGSGY